MDGKKYDYILSGDSLIVLDDVTEIKEVSLVAKSSGLSSEKAYNSSRKKRISASLFANNYTATLINLAISNGKKTYLKEIILYPYAFMNKLENDIAAGEVEIILAPNNNGLPDIRNPYLTFRKAIFSKGDKKWIIKLPQIMRYPTEGLYLVLFYKSNITNGPLLKLNDESDMLFYYPEERKWKTNGFNSYQYSVKILQ